jgi:hypothetical protein
VVRAKLHIRHGAVNPQNAARSQNTMIATSHTCQVISSRMSLRSLVVFRGLLVLGSARMKRGGFDTDIPPPSFPW